MTSQNVIIDIEKNNTPSKETVINCESSQEKFRIEVRSEITTEDICPVCLEKFKDLHKVYEFLPCHHYCCENCTKHIKLIRRNYRSDEQSRLGMQSKLLHPRHL